MQTVLERPQAPAPTPPGNVEALRRVYAEWERGNFRPSTDVYGPDLQWGWSAEFPGLEGVIRDTSPRSERMLRWLGCWERWRVVGEEYVTSDDTVVVLTRYLGRGLGSGVEVNVRGAHLWTMRDGRALRLEIFSSRERALALLETEGSASRAGATF